MVFINQMSKHIRLKITRRQNNAEIDMITRIRDSKPMAAVYTVSRGNVRARARVCPRNSLWHADGASAVRPGLSTLSTSN